MNTYIRDLISLRGGAQTAEIVNTRYTRYLSPIIDVSKDADALDHSQVFFGDGWDDGTNWRVLYTGQSQDTIVYAPDGLSYTNVDQVFLATKTKSNDVRTGWTKFPDVNGDPKPVFQPTFINGRFDKAQVWIRSIIKEGSTVYAWYVGDNGTPTFVYEVGMATSTDDGETWTRFSTSSVFNDTAASTSGRGIVIFKVVHNGTNYVAFFNWIDPNVTGFHIATSSDKTTWTKTHTGILAAQNYGFIGNVTYSGGNYYMWVQKNFQTGANLGPAKEMHLLRSSNLTDWTPLGQQLQIAGGGEFGVGNDCRSFIKPNGNTFLIHSYAKNAIEALAGVTQEAFTGIKVAEIGTSQVANSACAIEYPDFVLWHAPLGIDNGLSERIQGTVGTINTTSIFYAQHQFIAMNGSQTITFPNNGSVINPEHFGVKVRVEVKTTGTHEIFRIGDDIIMSIESGKLRVRLSSDGLGYEKDYITTVNISKPTGITYEDNHIDIGFIWGPSGTLTMFNDFVPFTAGQITETVDDALATVNNSSSNILIGQNATIELRSVSVLTEPTDDEFTSLDI